MKPNLFRLLFWCVALALTSACGPRVTSNETTTATEATPAAFQAQLQPVWERYGAVKDALVASDAARVREQASQLVQILQRVDSISLRPEDRRGWGEKRAELMISAENVGAAKTLEGQRQAFEKLSMGVYALVRRFGPGHTTLYKQYCPMAFDNQGAFWLSTSEEIKNPYFGDEMLECGEVQETLRADAKE